MAKKDYGTVTGKCPICEINYWSSCGNKPAIFPCGIVNCPNEEPGEYINTLRSEFGSSLQQLIEET